jgi:hypothetical protein
MSAPEIPGVEPGDREAVEIGFGEGGVPWYLLLLYLGFLVFFTWYVLEYQLPDYLEQGPGRAQQAAAEAK